MEDLKQNIEAQKLKAYTEVFNLLKIMPFRFSETRQELHDFLDFFNNEVWLK